MNRTKKIITVVLVFCLALAFAGCGKQKPSDAINEAIKAVQDMDTEKIKLYYGEIVTDIGDPTMYTSGVVQALTSRMTYKIDSVETNGDKATAQVTFTNVNMCIVNTKFFAQVLSDPYLADMDARTDDEINAHVAGILADQIRADDAQLLTATATVNLTYDADKKVWVINPNSVAGMVNAMFGDVYGGIYK